MPGATIRAWRDLPHDAQRHAIMLCLHPYLPPTPGHIRLSLPSQPAHRV